MKRAPKPSLPPKIRKTPSIIPQPRHSSGRFQPKPAYKPQAIPYMPSSTDGQ